MGKSLFLPRQQKIGKESAHQPRCTDVSRSPNGRPTSGCSFPRETSFSEANLQPASVSPSRRSRASLCSSRLRATRSGAGQRLPHDIVLRKGAGILLQCSLCFLVLFGLDQVHDQHFAAHWIEWVKIDGLL